MTLERLQAGKITLGTERLTELSEECLRRGGHKWAMTETKDHQQYCSHCLYLPARDKASP